MRERLNSLGLPETVAWEDGQLFLLDQTRLPQTVMHVRQNDVDQVVDSISRLVVRGAPAIGVAAAYGLLVDRESVPMDAPETFRAAMVRRADRLKGARPTAVNLAWAVDRMMDFLQGLLQDLDEHPDRSGPFEGSADAIWQRLIDEAIAIDQKG